MHVCQVPCGIWGVYGVTLLVVSAVSYLFSTYLSCQKLLICTLCCESTLSHHLHSSRNLGRNGLGFVGLRSSHVPCYMATFEYTLLSADPHLVSDCAGKSLWKVSSTVSVYHDKRLVRKLRWLNAGISGISLWIKSNDTYTNPSQGCLERIKIWGIPWLQV